MNKESPENKAADTQDVEKEATPDAFENNYRHYLELGGIINEKDYNDVLSRAESITSLDETRVKQVQDIAKFSGIKLLDPKAGVDERVVLYVILRSDIVPEPKYHHSQMSDQRIFGEVLRMLGDADSLDKLIKAYPNISFEYERGKQIS